MVFGMQNMFFLFGVQENLTQELSQLQVKAFIGVHMNSDTKTVLSAEEDLFVWP